MLDSLCTEFTYKVILANKFMTRCLQIFKLYCIRSSKFSHQIHCNCFFNLRNQCPFKVYYKSHEPSKKFVSVFRSFNLVFKLSIPRIVLCLIFQTNRQARTYDFVFRFKTLRLSSNGSTFEEFGIFDETPHTSLSFTMFNSFIKIIL